MNIDQACEQITLLKTVLETRNVDIGIRTLDQLIRFIGSQQKTIEDMKCCGNCEHEDIDMEGNNDCRLYKLCTFGYSRNKTNINDLWKLI